MTNSVTSPALSYENYVVPALFSPWAERLVDSMAPGPGDRVLDVACGTGIVARKAAARVLPAGRVAGIDPSVAMLEVARSVHDAGDIEWHEGKAESLPFPDGSFNFVFCQQGVQFFADRQAGLSEIHRVLESGGRCAVALWRGIEHHPFFQALDGAIQRHLGSSAAQVPFSLGNADELRALLEDAGFGDVHLEAVSMQARYAEPDRFVSETVGGLRAVVPALQDPDKAETVLSAIQAGLQGPLEEATQGDELVLTWHAHIARAVRP